MIYQIASLQEVKYLFLLSTIFLGYQIGLLFIFQYFKLKNEKIRLNKVLLSYGFFLLLGFTCLLFLTINNFFITDEIIAETFRKIAYISVILTTILFWFFINDEQFSVLINLKVIRVLVFLTFIPLIAAIFINTDTQIFRYTLGVLVFHALYLAFFQYRVIQQSRGTIKKRFIIIFLAEILFFIALMLGADIPLMIFNITGLAVEILFFIGILLLTTSLVFFFIAIYDFPPILEFKWKENLSKLFIVNQKTNNCLFACNFSDPLFKKIDISEEKGMSTQRDFQDLFSGAITGIEGIISAITDTKNERINIIKHSDSLILLEYCTQFEETPLYYALVVDHDSSSIRYFLSELKTQFESFYKEILMCLSELKGKKEQLFGSFNIIIKNLLN